MATRSDPIAVERLPSRWQNALFEAKAWGLRLRRAVRDRINGFPPLHMPGSSLQDAAVLAEFESPLWPREEMDQTLVAGKIHNLRLAAKRLHGLEIPADAVFSFWRQLGRASAVRGYVQGRELREGCIIPAIGGGLCQLSNGIYDAAVRAGLGIVERHRHSRALPGSLAELDRDATIFWNYLDLRLLAGFAWRLEVDLDQTRLRVRIRASTQALPLLPIHVRQPADSGTNDCSTCAQEDCYSHTGLRELDAHRTWLIDEPWPEFVDYLQSLRAGRDHAPGDDEIAIRKILRRTWERLRWRWWLWRGHPIPEARAFQLERRAERLARKLGPEDLHLVVSQGLLPYLWRSGELSGRRVDVLMDALPMMHIQRQLDHGAGLHPGSSTLVDFRAPAGLIEAENAALSLATLWISPHREILDLAGAKALPLPWRQPMPGHRNVRTRSAGSPAILFPASALARKGAFELREALAGLSVRLLLPPGAMETPDLWRQLDVGRVASIAEGLALADLVVLPAWVEHQPRGLLAAMAAGIPVIATAACGLPPDRRWTRVEAGDPVGLRLAIIDLLDLPVPSLN